VLCAFGVGVGVLAYHAGAADRTGPQPAGRDGKPPEAPKAAAQVAAVLKDAKAAADAIEDKQRKAWTLQAVAEELAKGGDNAAAARTYQEAIQAAKEIKDDPNDKRPEEFRAFQVHHTIGWIAVSQAQIGDVKGALETARAMESDSARDYALAYIAVAQIEAGDIKGGLQTAEDVSFNKKDWVLSAAARAQAAAGNVKEARQTAEKIGNDPSLLAAIAAAQARAKDRDAAKKTLQEALKIAGEFSEGNPDTGDDGSRRGGAFGAIAGVQAAMGDVKEARQTADALKEPWKSNALRSIATAEIKAGDVKGALQTAEAIEGEYPKGEVLKEVLTAQLRLGDLKEGQQTAAAIKSVFWRVVALTEIAKAQAKAGDRTAAVESFRKAFAETGVEGGNVRDEEPGLGGLRNVALALIVRAQAEAGEEKEAIAWAAKQSNPLLKAQALLNIARGIASSTEREKRP
jgi:tetratricopeptide (TPR) repeat protein